MEYNKCDEQHIIGMLAAEKKTCKIKLTAWSPKFSRAVEDKAFWKIALSLRRSYTRPNDKFYRWAMTRGIDDFAIIDTKTILKNLRTAQQNLRDIKRQANQLREAHLRELIQITQESGDDKQHERRLKILLRAHSRQQSYKRLQHILKPKEHSGLSYVLVPEDFQPENYPYEPTDVKQWTMVHEPDTVKKYIMLRNINHFGQAHGSPFTKPPLSAISWTADDSMAEALLSGQIPEEIKSNDTYVQDVLEEITASTHLPEIDTYISSEDVARGFKSWKESTSTSPSGCHLGLRRITAFPIQDKELDKKRMAILGVQTDIINIPLHMGFSPKRWQTVVNAMLEKTPGTPYLHKLRVIHLLEADYNLTLKAIFGRRLMKNCEMHGALGDLQDGFRKGRSTTRTLLHNEIINDYNKRLRIDNYMGMTDISGCFDRILPSIISLLNRINGCPKEAVQMHAKTLSHAQYHLKTQHGISKEHYSNATTPVYGNGQGAGDSPSQWSQESALLFNLYQKRMTGTTICDRAGHCQTAIPLAAFADDTNLFGNNNDNSKSREDLTNEARLAFTHWNGLLSATGHFMELQKCSCYLQFWQFQDDGYAYTEEPESHGLEVTITDIQGQAQRVPQLRASDSQKLLGVMKNPMGNQQDEIKRLKQKSDNMARRINSNRITRADARIAYEVFYIPAVRYSLNITAINQIDMETIQSKAVMAFLAAQGYNRHMPREVVFAPTLYQGLGLRHLYDIQGTDSTRLIIQELNQQPSTTRKMLLALLDTIQLESGIGQPILENCRALEYIEWGWIPQIRDFLWHINGRILGATKQPQIYREHDRYLMDDPYIDSMSRREKIYIHRCRICLQVETISDITSSDGTKIDQAWYSADTNKPSKSTYRWPRQQSPNRPAWQAWKKFLDSFCSESGSLKEPLGNWTQMNKNRRYSAYFQIDNNTLWRQKDNQWTTHRLIQQHRTYWRFANESEPQGNRNPPPEATPIDIINISEGSITTRQARPINSTTTNQLSTNTPWFMKSVEALDHIVGTVQLLQDTDDIRTIFSERARVDIASDGGHDPETGISTFGWVAAVNKLLIAKGRGPAQVHPQLAESFRSEGYGLASALIFINNLIRTFDISPREHVWNIYIDNKSLIQRMDGYSLYVPIPRWNLRADEDITKTVRKLMQELPVKLIHIKSHQDDDQDWEKLSFQAQLNVMADEEATRQRNAMDEPESRVTRLLTAQLQIGMKDITRDSQQWLLHSAGRIPLQEYYYQKWGWSTKTFNAISWKTQKTALKHFEYADQTRILKFVHGWLPTQHRLYKEGAATSPHCRLCDALYDDNIHLLHCTHKEMSKLQDGITAWLLKSLHDHGNSEITNITEMALTECPVNNSWQPSIENVSREWRPGVQEQTDIGWLQIIYGRISTRLIRGMDSHYKTLPINSKKYNGERWATKLIINIWTTILQLWQQRNKIIYEVSDQANQEANNAKLIQRIRRCYSLQTQLTASERRTWFDKELDDKLQEDAQHLRVWLDMVERLIRISKREQKKRPKSSLIMEQFLGIRAPEPQQNPALQPVQNHRALPHDMNPD
jgi:hypothetical protein